MSMVEANRNEIWRAISGWGSERVSSKSSEKMRESKEEKEWGKERVRERGETCDI